MSESDTPATSRAPVHPLAADLAALLAGRERPRLLVLGYGSGRNLPPFVALGARIDLIEEDAARASAARERFASSDALRTVQYPHGPYDGALSTHALLHGTPASVGSRIDALRVSLANNAPFHATLGSQNDPRYGRGRRVAPGAYAPLEGSEAGVSHAYFDEGEIRALLAAFVIDDLREGDASQSAGAWAHLPAEAAGMRHWFVRARRAQ